MCRPSAALGVVLTFALPSPGAVRAAGDEPASWPSFRGYRARGVAEGHATPTRWDAEKGAGILWKTPVPGLAHSSPVIWGERMFLTTAVRSAGDADLKVGLYGDIQPVRDDTGHEWRVYCLDRKSGRVVWKRTAHEGKPRIRRHPKSSHANSTPATDGRRVVAFFGSEGLYCFDTDGELIWKKDLGVLDSGYYVAPGAQWGFGSSPVIHGDAVIVQCDVQRGSFIALFDVRDGKPIWRRDRDDVPTWSTPTIYEHGGRARIAVNGYRHIGGYDAATGAEVWRLRGGGDIPVPTPVIGHGLIFVTSAHGRMSPVYAIRTEAEGDITPPDRELRGGYIRWAVRRGGNYMQTPLLYRGLLYCCRDNGVLTCYEAKTGARRYRERLGSGGSGFTASAVAADGKIYFPSEDGDVYVVRAGPEFELLATNPMGETCMATPAIARGTLFFRTRRHVVAVGGAAGTGGE